LADIPSVSIFFTLGGVLLGTMIGATLELRGHGQAICLAAVVAAQLAYVLMWMLVQDRVKQARLK